MNVSKELIDEYGDVAKLREEFAATEKRYGKLREQLNAAAGELEPDQEFALVGGRWQIAVSAKKLERTVNKKAARKRLGAAAFFNACSITLTALGNLLSKPDVDALADSDRTGARSYTASPVSDTN